MVKFIATIVLLLVCIGLALSPASAVVYVKWDSPGPTYDGNAWDTAYHSIQQGLDAASGGEVRVARGIYAEQITLKSGVALNGGYSGVGDTRDIRANATVVDGSQADGGRTVTGANSASIDGFTIHGGDDAVYCKATSPTISHNIISGAVSNGIYCFSSSALIVNNVIRGNDVGIACDTCSPTITGNTIVGNDDIAVSMSAFSNPSISNNIVAFNATGLYKWTAASGDSTPTQSKNDVYGNTTANYTGVTAGGTNISADPLFISISTGNLHILPSSPCRNVGGNSAPGISTTDVDGQARIEGGTVDIGADESYGETASGTIRVVYVKASAPEGGNGTSWATAYNTIQAGLDDASVQGGGEVWVAKGVYDEQVVMRLFVGLYGGFAGTESLRSGRMPSANPTVISAPETTVPTVWGANYATVDGFTIRGGYHGVSCYYTSPTISNNIIAANGKTGVHCHGGSAVITNNVIVGNDAGISCDIASPRIYNNIAAYNRIGISNNSATPVLSHNDVYGNTAYNYFNTVVGTGDISSNPLFANYTLGNLHIQSNSPCRNTGDNAAPGLPAYDTDGQARIQGGTVDIGVDESYGETYSVSTRVLRVNTAAALGGDGSSWALAYKTIQSAVNNVSLAGGAEIWVARGTYGENITMLPFAHLYGGFAGTETSRSSKDIGANPTVIDGSGSDMSIPAVRAVSISTLDGFTVTGGFTGVGCGLGSPTVTNNVISGNATYGVMCGSSAVVTKNLVLGNTDGISCHSGSPTVTLNTITGNRNCGVTSGSTAVIAGNIISGNGTGVLCDYESPTLTNNTIVGNSVCGIIYDYASSPVVRNNISAYNAYGVFNDIGTYATPGNTWGLPSLRNNDFYSNSNGNYSQVTPGTADITTDPKIASILWGNYHIAYTSPCRNTGYNSATGKPSVDMDGQARTNETTVDIGADETYGETYPSPYPTRIIYVDTAAPPGGNGTTWAAAYRSIWEAMGNAWTNGAAEVWVASGTYEESVLVAPLTQLHGGFNGTETARSFRNPSANVTVIDASTTGGPAAVVCPGSVTIDGFTVTGGAVGILAESGSPTIYGNMITGNTEAGIVCGSNATVTNCLVTGNGSGIYCSSGSPGVFNNTIADNSQFGFSYAYASSPRFVNGISAFNAVGVLADPTTLGAAVVSHNVVHGNSSADYSGRSAGGWSYVSDPRFANRAASDYHVLSGSPAIDSGAEGSIWFTSDFNSFANGNLAGQAPWTGTAGPVRVESTFAMGGKAAEANYKLWGVGDSNAAVSSGPGYHYIDVDVAMNVSGAVAGTNLGYLRFMGASGLEITRIYLTAGQLKVLLGPATPFVVMNGVPNNVWQHVRLGIDLSTTKLDVWVNGVRQLTAGTPYHGDTSIASIGYGQWDMGASTFTVSEAYIDNLLCQTALASSAAPSADLDGTGRPLDGDGNGTAIVDIGSYEYLRNRMTISAAKNETGNAAVGISGPVSTAAFGDRFYVENPDRSSGIGVLGTVSSPGKRVTVEGIMTTVDGERMVLPSVVWEGSSALVPSAPMMSHYVLGGGPFGSQAGVTGGVGVNNIGLLVSAFGRVTDVDPAPTPTWFTIDDGSGVNVRCLAPATVTIDPGWQYVRVQGISSCETDGSELHRLIRVRTTGDIVSITP